MVLDPVSIPPAVLVLDDAASFGQVRNDPERCALRYTERRRDVAEARTGVVGDTDKGSRVLGEEAPLRHEQLR